MENANELITQYLQAERFVDRLGQDLYGELTSLSGKAVSEWLMPALTAGQDGQESARRFYRSVAQKAGPVITYDHLKSGHYSSIVWTLNELIGRDLIKSGDSVLDVGCATGLEACLFAKVAGNGRVVGIDVIDEMLALAKDRAQKHALSNVSFLNADRDNLPFSEKEFDKITCLHSFTEGDNYPNIQGDLTRCQILKHRAKGFRRVLKDSGKLMIFIQSREDLIDYNILSNSQPLISAGFEIEETKPYFYGKANRPYRSAQLMFVAKKSIAF